MSIANRLTHNAAMLPPEEIGAKEVMLDAAEALRRKDKHIIELEEQLLTANTATAHYHDHLIRWSAMNNSELGAMPVVTVEEIVRFRLRVLAHISDLNAEIKQLRESKNAEINSTSSTNSSSI